VAVVALSILTIMQTGIDKVTIKNLLSAILSAAIVLVFVWFISAGNLKNQYNSAVKKGYPEHCDRLRL